MITATVATKEVPNYGQLGYDRLVADKEQGIFGIFDGMGVSDGAEWAANQAANLFKEAAPTYFSYKNLAMALENIIKLVGVRPDAGTTATIVYVDPAGDLHYAHVGDSRLYILNDGRVKQITADEGVGNVLYNYVGGRSKGVCQLGTVTDWQKAMLCSDGVTGDWKEQLISDRQIELALFNNTPEKAIDKILAKSTKVDDKSIIVIGNYDDTQPKV